MKTGLARSLAVSLAVVTATTLLAGQPAFNLQDTMPFDAAVRTATLPNGLK
jgi:hypothetical protein